METLKLIKHAPGAPGLRLMGLGPDLLPCRGLLQLQRLFEEHAFWAKERNLKDLRKLLEQSNVTITLWNKKQLIGFGRATSDGIYRAVLWDIVVADHLQRKGLGRKVVESLLDSKLIKNVERVYLMTTRSCEFYEQLGFRICKDQSLLIKK